MELEEIVEQEIGKGYRRKIWVIFLKLENSERMKQ
jgi:hypothetical protein